MAGRGEGAEAREKMETIEPERHSERGVGDFEPWEGSGNAGKKKDSDATLGGEAETTTKMTAGNQKGHDNKKKTELDGSNRESTPGGENRHPDIDSEKNA